MATVIPAGAARVVEHNALVFRRQWRGSLTVSFFTPLFFIGATLGNLLARLLGIPLELGAAVGLAAVFGAAANTPLALSLMMVELMGGAVLPYVVVVTVIAYLLSGHRGIYPAQRLLRKKHGPALERPVPLREYRG